MARSLNRLPANVLTKKLAAGRHSDGGNLYLAVSPSGARRWVFLFRGPGSKPIEMGLGSATALTLARAREKAADARQLLAEGRNPLLVRRTELARPTFGQAADDLIAALRPSWKNQKHADQWVMTLTEYAAPLRALRVDQVGTDEVLGVIRPMWQTLPETAVRLRGRIEKVLDAAKVRGHRSGDNPARWRGHLELLLPSRPKLTRGHHAAMPYNELRAFMRTLRSTLTLSNLALEFTILTAARSGESRGLVWDEIDRSDALWSVPPERMKEERAHRVPLCDRALEVLELASRIAGKRQSEFAFPGARVGSQLSDMSLTMALRRNTATRCTVHGFRSSFRDWVADETDFEREVAEAALSHLVGDESERAYRRGDALEKRRRLMHAWQTFLTAGPDTNATEPKNTNLVSAFANDNEDSAQVAIRPAR